MVPFTVAVVVVTTLIVNGPFSGRFAEGLVTFPNRPHHLLTTFRRLSRMATSKGISHSCAGAAHVGRPGAGPRTGRRHTPDPRPGQPPEAPRDPRPTPRPPSSPSGALPGLDRHHLDRLHPLAGRPSQVGRPRLGPLPPHGPRTPHRSADPRRRVQRRPP